MIGPIDLVAVELTFFRMDCAFRHWITLKGAEEQFRE